MSLATLASPNLDNLAEYEGYLDEDERLLADVIRANERLRDDFVALPPIAAADA